MLLTESSEKNFYICPKIIGTIDTIGFNPKDIITDASKLEKGKEYYTATNKDILQQIYYFNNNIPIENNIITQDFGSYKSFFVGNNHFNIGKGYLISTQYLKTSPHKGNFYIATFKEYLNTYTAQEKELLQLWWQFKICSELSRKIIVLDGKIQILFYPALSNYKISFSLIK